MADGRGPRLSGQPYAATGTPGARPRLSVMIPTYQPNELLCEALHAVQSAVAAAGVAAHIEVVDDASPTTDVKLLLEAWAKADKVAAVSFYRRRENGGLGRCWNECVERATGEYVHILHQDDLLDVDFYRRLLEVADRFPQAGMVFCRTRFLEGMSERLDRLEQEYEGLIEGWLSKICSAQRLQCPSVIVKRSVYQKLGGFETSLRYVIDWEMWIRIAAFYSVAYVPAPLAVYRIHSGAESARLKLAGVVTRDAARGLRRIKRTLRETGRMDCYRPAVEFGIAISGFAAYEAERAAEWRLVAKEVMEGLLCFGLAMSPPVLFRQFRGYLRASVKSWIASASPRTEGSKS